MSQLMPGLNFQALVEGAPSFASESEAWGWLNQKMEAMDEFCVDNYRFAYNDDREAILKYNQLQNEGCCGFFDREVRINGRLATIGCNYGH